MWLGAIRSSMKPMMLFSPPEAPSPLPVRKKAVNSTTPSSAPAR